MQRLGRPAGALLMSSTSAWATYHSELGWPVFPCGARSKTPLTPHGFKDASDLADDVERWWQRWPDANIGIATGISLWVLDVDPKNGGLETLAALESAHEPIHAPMVRTGGGGFHFYFSCSDAVSVPSRQAIMPGLDTRGVGGYVIAAGSIHENCNVYAWVDGCSPEERSLMPAPDWLLEIVCGQRETYKKVAVVALAKPLDAAKRVEIESALDRINADSRDHWLRVGMALHATHCSDAREVWDTWSRKSAKFEPTDQDKTWGGFTTERKNDIGLATLFGIAYASGWTNPVKHTARPAMPPTVGASGQSPWKEPEWIGHEESTVRPRLDMQAALPPELQWLRDWLCDISEVFQCPVEFAALIAVGMASGAIGGRFEIALEGAEWIEASPLWILCAMPSGAGKSPPYKALRAPFDEYDHKLDQRGEMAQHAARVRVAQAVLDNLLQKLKKQAAAGEGSDQLRAIEERVCDAELALAIAVGSKPALREITASDLTTPALVKFLQDHSERCLLLDPEGSVFKYALGGTTDLEKSLDPWLKAYSCEPIKENRIGNGSKESAERKVERPVLAFAVCTQTRNLALFGDRYAEGKGFLARFIVATFPYDLPATAVTRRRLSLILSERWRLEMHRLLEPRRPVEPMRVTLSGPESDRFEAWANEWLSAARADIEDDEASCVGYGSPFGAKLRGMALRLVLLLHVLQYDDPASAAPSRATLDCVLNVWVPFIKSQNARLSEAMRTDSDASIAERILAWIDRNDIKDFSRRDAYRSTKSSAIGKPADLDSPLIALTEANWIRPIGVAVNRGHGAITATRYEVNPDLAARFRTLLAISRSARQGGQSQK